MKLNLKENEVLKNMTQQPIVAPSPFQSINKQNDSSYNSQMENSTKSTYLFENINKYALKADEDLINRIYKYNRYLIS